MESALRERLAPPSYTTSRDTTRERLLGEIDFAFISRRQGQTMTSDETSRDLRRGVFAIASNLMAPSLRQPRPLHPKAAY